MDLTQIINALIGLLATALTAILIPLAKSRISSNKWDDLLKWVEIGVAAAEQLYTSLEGGKKKAYVIQYLESKGYKIDSEDVENAIEAAVLQLHNELYGTEKAA